MKRQMDSIQEALACHRKAGLEDTKDKDRE